MAFRSSAALIALTARTLAQTSSSSSSSEAATECIKGDAPAGETAATVTATQVIGASGTSYINTASECDANTMYSGPGATEWAMPGAAPTASGSSSIEGANEFEGPSGTTKFVRVVLATSYANGTATAPSTTFTAPLATDTGRPNNTTSIDFESIMSMIRPLFSGATRASASMSTGVPTTEESSAPFGNSTTTIMQQFPTASIGTAVSIPEESSAPFGNGTTTIMQQFPTASIGTAVPIPEESSAPFGNGTTTMQQFPTASMGTAVTTISESSAPFGNGTTTFAFDPTRTGAIPTISGSCGGLEGSSYLDQNGVEYEVRAGADSSINSYNSTNTRIIQECFMACAEQSQCKGFTYVTSGFSAGICYLKSAVGDFVTSENTKNMCSVFRITPAGNTTTSSSASGSVVPTPDPSSAPFQNGTTSAPVADPVGTATSSSRRCAFICPDYIDSCGQYYGPGCFTSCPGVPGPTFTTPVCSGTTSAAVSVSINTISSSVPAPVRPVNTTTTASTTPQPERTIVSTQTVTSVKTQVQTLSQQNGTTTVVQTAVHTSEIPHTITINRDVPFTTVATRNETLILTTTKGDETIVKTVEVPVPTTKTVIPEPLTGVATHNQTVTLTTTKGDETIVKTVEVPVPTTKTITPAAHTDVTTVDRPVPFTTIATHNQTVVLTTTKGDKTIVKTVQVPVPTTKTVTPKAPVSYRTKTTTVSKIVTLPCTKKACHKSSTTSMARYNTTVVDTITASCSTIPPVYVTKTSTIKTTLSSPRKVTTSECEETYTVPESTTWIWEPETLCNGTSTTLSKPVKSEISHTTSTIYATSTATVTKGNLTSLITTCIEASTTVVPVHSTLVVPVTASASSTPATSPVAPISKPSAPGSSPVAPVSKPSAPASSPEVPVSKPSAPASSPEVPVSKPSASASSPEAPVSKPSASASSPEAPVSKPSAPASSPEAPVSQPPMESVSHPGSSPVAPFSPQSSAHGSTPVAPMSPESTMVQSSVAIPSSPEAPVSKPSAPASSPEAPVSQSSIESVASHPGSSPQSSAHGSTPIAPMSSPESPVVHSSVAPPVPETPKPTMVYSSAATQPSAPGSSPASPETPDTTLTTRVGTAITSSSPVVVTATRPGESPVSPEKPSVSESQPQPSAPASSPVSPEQPSVPASSAGVTVSHANPSQYEPTYAPTKTGSVPTESVTGGASATSVSVFAGLIAVAAVMLAF